MFMPWSFISIYIRIVDDRLYVYDGPLWLTSTILNESQLPSNPSYYFETVINLCVLFLAKNPQLKLPFPLSFYKT